MSFADLANEWFEKKIKKEGKADSAPPIFPLGVKGS
jgi:hypothetical protein